MKLQILYFGWLHLDIRWLLGFSLFIWPLFKGKCLEFDFHIQSCRSLWHDPLWFISFYQLGFDANSAGSMTCVVSFVVCAIVCNSVFCIKYMNINELCNLTHVQNFVILMSQCFYVQFCKSIVDTSIIILLELWDMLKITKTCWSYVFWNKV